MDSEVNNSGDSVRPDPKRLARFAIALANAKPVESKMPEVEWNFSRCPTAQLEYCRVYEYSRSSPGMIARVDQWRREGFAGADHSVLDNFHLAAVKPMDFFRLFPEFPQTPWLVLDAGEVKRRLKSRLKRIPVLVRSVPVENLKEDGEYKDAVSVLKAYQTTTIQPLEINWFFHDTVLLTAFKLWLAANRPYRPKEKRGRTEPRVLLNALAAKRLLDVHSVAECEEITGTVLRKPLFRGDSNWYDGKAKAEKLLEGRIPPIPIEGLIKNMKLLTADGFTEAEINQLWQHLVSLKDAKARELLRPKDEKFVVAMRKLLEKLRRK